MNRIPRVACVALAALALGACGGEAQQSTSMVRSSDPALAELAEAILPDLAERSGLRLVSPVRLETRTRDELVGYLEYKLDEELPEDEARHAVESYALLGLVPDTLDLRGVLLSLYTEQVAGFYDPDSTALFVLDDQPPAALQGLLVHELVHAVQDQSVDLDALTHRDLGNDRQTAAQAAIEGHATLVMLEYLTEQLRGSPVDLGEIPDFAATLRPTLEGMTAQFPALSGAPAVIRESLLFPYVEGAAYVQDLWRGGARVAPFGERLPVSTEQVLTHDRNDTPVSFTLAVEGGSVLYSEGLGRLEVGVFLEAHVGPGGASLAEGWGGDRFALVDAGDRRGLAWVTVWDDVSSRDDFVAALVGHLGGFPGGATLGTVTVGDRPGAVLRVGLPDVVSVAASPAS